MSASSIRVALVEDHTLLAQSLVFALSAEGFDATIVRPPTTGDAMSLLPTIRAARPQVVLLDLDLGPAGDSAPLIGPLQDAGCQVVVVTGVTQRTRWGECLARGACTVLPKSAPLDAIAATVRTVVAGGTVMAPAQRHDLVREWEASRRQHQNVDARFDRLTSREESILAALLAGQRVRNIAAEWFVAESTVRSQVKSILAKLGVTSQIAAVAMARDAGWQPSAAQPVRRSRTAAS